MRNLLNSIARAVVLPILWWIGFVVSAQAGLYPVQEMATGSGMKVMLVASHFQPMVVVRVMVRAGSVYDPPGMEGTADLVAATLDEGAGELDGEALRERLDYYGIILQTHVEQDVIKLEMTTLAEYLEEGMARLADCLIRPHFPARAFERERQNLLTRLTKEQEVPEKLASKALASRIFAGHPYGRPASGDAASVAKITLEALRNHHHMGFRGPDMVMAVAGDVTKEGLQPLLQRYFAPLNPEPSPLTPPSLAEPDALGSHQHISMNLTQTTIRLGWVGINREDPDYYAMQVMNHLLGGGGFASRLTKEIREKRGLTYGVFSYFNPLAARGPFVVGMQTKTASTQEALVVIRQELDRLVNGDLTETELEENKQDMIGSFPLRLETLNKLADHWVLIGFYRRGTDYLDRWSERIRGVTVEEVVRVAQRILRTKAVHQVTVGSKDSDAKP